MNFAETAFLAPFSGQFSVGLSYKPFGEWQIGLLPLSGWMTYVRLGYLADAGAFGLKPPLRNQNGEIVSPASKTLWESGVRFTSQLDLTLFKTLSLKHFLGLFHSYSIACGNLLFFPSLRPPIISKAGSP